VPPSLDHFGQGLLQKAFACWPPTEPNIVNLLGNFFFSLIRNVCVNLKSILILGTVVERVINRQNKAHESGAESYSCLAIDLLRGVQVSYSLSPSWFSSLQNGDSLHCPSALPANIF